MLQQSTAATRGRASPRAAPVAAPAARCNDAAATLFNGALDAAPARPTPPAVRLRAPPPTRPCAAKLLAAAPGRRPRRLHRRHATPRRPPTPRRLPPLPPPPTSPPPLDAAPGASPDAPSTTLTTPPSPHRRLHAICDEQEQRVLVLLNPKSGPGRARDVFQQRVVPVFAEAEIPFDLHVTKHAGYARDFVRSRDIYQWRAIIVVGGDGILFEVINGLFERPDWQQAVKEIGIGIIPCGSGNGLAKTIAYMHEEPFDQNPVLISTLNIIKAKKVPMDLVRVETKSQIMFSFLSVGWGLLSDIDIESEKLRAIGGQRFTVWSVARLIGLRTYRGRLSYEPVEDGLSDDKNRIRPSEALLTRSSSHYPTETVSTLREHTNGVPPEGRLQAMHASRSFDFGALPDDFLDETDTLTDSLSLETAVSQGVSDLDSPGSATRPRLDSYYSANSRYSAYFSTADSSYRSVDVTIAGDGSPRVVYGPPSRLPALTQPVPSHWKTIEGDFVLVHASYQTHLGSDCLFAPSSKLDDGIIWLLIIRAGITRTQLLQFLLGLSSGSHLSCPRAEMIPVTAFRLEPESTRGHLTVDGELVDYGPVQAELMPSLANIMSR